MSDTDRIRQREHWQAIAEQLGLACDPESPSESTTEAASERSVGGLTPAVQPEPVEPTSVVEQWQLSRKEGDPEHATDREEEERSAWNPPPTAEAPHPLPATAQPDEDVTSPKQSRKRQTAQTAASSGGERKEAAAVRRAPVNDKGSGKRGGRSARRSRSKSRDKDEQQADDSAVGQGVGEAQTSAQAEESEEEASSDAYNWNVPSWDELIGSLYRPER